MSNNDGGQKNNEETGRWSQVSMHTWYIIALVPWTIRDNVAYFYVGISQCMGSLSEDISSGKDGIMPVRLPYISMRRDTLLFIHM